MSTFTDLEPTLTDLALPYAVYGTLREGFGNDRIWRGLATWGGFDLLYGYRLVSAGGFPYAIPSEDPEEAIVVEIITPKAPFGNMAHLRSCLDGLEGYPRHYDRIWETTDGGVECWLYTPQNPERVERLPRVRDNDWAEWEDPRRTYR